ncbi:acyl-CoA thioesterase [Undibacterium jejuense]|uniref:Acyl-CoA thioesterase n=1 Tax=Undibacterium jejuense TaxID=1344949 RepID=A0A923HEU9_9BURK|nr:thioesterase family protein [Undibacterium jejuense]MBC3860735.1 acyl-CoA thioesterase [Undibacterium jejuense]
MARQDFAFFHSLRVRWSEVDMQAIVFNGNYLNYFDVALTEYWRATGLPNAVTQAADGKELFARKASLDYFSPARFDDVLDLGVRCNKLGRSSMQFIVEIFRGEAHLISGELVYVYADSTLRKGVAVPDEWREIIHTLEIIKPSGGN